MRFIADATLLLVAMPFVTSSFLFLVVMPGATSSFLLLADQCKNIILGRLEVSKLDE